MAYRIPLATMQSVSATYNNGLSIAPFSYTLASSDVFWDSVKQTWCVMVFVKEGVIEPIALEDIKPREE